MQLERARQIFDVDDTIVSALASGERVAATSQERYRFFRSWNKRHRRDKRVQPEYLLPRVVRKIQREWPSYMVQRGHLDWTREELQVRVKELGPWTVPFRLGHGLMTTDRRKTCDRILFRRDLINGTVTALLGEELADTTVLDLGCSAGFFSLDIAANGAKHVDGFDLRPSNVEKARFLTEHYAVANASFTVADVDELQLDRQWDVVLNLGLLYHVTNPLQLVRQTYELCRQFAVIDTVCHHEPVSAYLLFGDKDVNRPAEGREEFEFHPTYRAVIDTMRYAGFSTIIEVVGMAELPHDLYARGHRRCFLAMK
jgi:2-polyprenyl-3-methyl-5-hydroxy-6-metoxy-1,4-benzoquinol methylase